MMTEMYQVFKGTSSLAPSSSVTPTLTLTYILANVKGDNEPNTTTDDPLSHTKRETDANKQENPEEPKYLTDANIEFIGSTTPQPLITQAQPITIINLSLSYIEKAKLHYLTVDQIETHIDNEEKIKKDVEEAMLLIINKHVEIKVVREEAKKLRIHPKEAVTAKAGKLLSYSNPGTLILDSSFMSFLFLPETWDGYCIGIGAGRADRIPSSSRFALSFQYGIFFTNVFNDQAFQRWNDIHKVRIDSLVSYLVMASTNKTPKNARFSLKLRKLIAEHPDQEKLKSKKVKLEALGYHLD
nr:protein kinase superfamily protein [Tanacetum cinerariifolium]